MSTSGPVVKKSWIVRHRNPLNWSKGLLVTLVAALLLILGVVALRGCVPESRETLESPGVAVTSGATATPTATPTPTASSTDTSTASAPVVGPAPSSAPATVPAEPAAKISLNQMQPASDITWMEQFKGKGLNRIVYTGEYASADDLEKWLDAAKRNGFNAEVRLDNVIANLPADDARAYGQKLARHDNLKAFVVSVHADNFQMHYDVAASIGTVPVVTWDDFPMTANNRGTIVPLFLPFPERNDYGVVSDYTKVGQAVAGRDGASGWAGVQAFSWKDSEPDFAAQWHFPAGRPSPADVEHFAQLLHDQGVQNILIYTEEPAADDTAYLQSCVEAVKRVLGR